MSVATTMKPAMQALKLPSHRDPYYAGKWQKPKAARYVDVTNPGTGETLGKVVEGAAADVEAAVAAAKAAFREWRRVPTGRAGRDAARHRRRAAQERRRAGDDRCRRLRESLWRDGARRQCGCGAARLLRRPRYRDEGRLDSDGSGRGEFLRAR